MKAILEFHIIGHGQCADCRFEGRDDDYDCACFLTQKKTPEEGRRDDCPLRFEL